MGLFEYKVMPFGLKGAPATFQANINAFLQPLLVLGPATDPSDPPHKTRGIRTDYRQLAGLRRRACRKRLPSQPVTHPPTAPNPDPESPTPTERQQTSTSPVLDWPAAYSKCPVFSDPYHTASTKPGKVVQLEFQHRRHTFRFVLPYLHICVGGLWLICVPQFPEFLTHVLCTHHDHVTAGHRGQKKTYTALSKHCYWPGMRAYTNAYVESCTQCRASKSLNQKPAGFLQQLFIPSRRWSHVSVDFVTGLPLTTTGHDAILVVVDSLSKLAHFIPAKKSHSAADIVELLADLLIRYHGFPDVLVSDRDPRFQSEVWSQLCSRFNITRAMSSSYHPQTDGPTERVNRTLEQMPRRHI
ncbi:hypothetical protein EBH_0033310 [Eimeria brunetti]|uniref:Integrase catalytic domain-containing protein n=1 Tax=Eimeria brunetti TaxID=51314 RepID=U6LP86_9EIME|nr:hypothetical protein EBH_0033310 [Eimeria brunetti]